MKQFFLFVFSLLLFTACLKNSTELPEELPESFRLQYVIDGGMSDYKADIVVFNDSLRVTIKNDSVFSHRVEKLENMQITTFYSFLKKETPHLIKQYSVKEKMDLRGGRILKISWDKKEIVLKDAQNSFIAEENFENWIRVTNEIEKLAGIAK